MTFLKIYTPIFITVAIQLVLVSSSKILVLILIGSRSHRIAFDPLFLELAHRGHEMTVLSFPIYEKSQNISNFREIRSLFGEEDYAVGKLLYARRLRGEGSNQTEVIERWIQKCEANFQLPEVQALLDEKFDLVMIDSCNACAFGLLTHFQAPYVLLGTFTVLWYFPPHLGVPTLPSSSPYMWYHLNENAGFVERLEHFYNHLLMEGWRKHRIYDKYHAYQRQRFPGTPPMMEIFQNTSLVLHNSHRSVDGPALTVPGIVQIGGMQCRPGKPLPEELNNFVEGSGSAGFIYFSMGSFIAGSVMPNETRDTFLNVFGKLKQRVLWKFESDLKGADLPKNVKLIRWAPQQDILAHPKIKLFITQGGLPSTHEAVYHAVPILGIPIFFDQDDNIKKVERRGAGLLLDLKSITEEYVLEKINKILNDASFSENAKKLGAEFRDNPMKPVDSAVYWVEYVLRYGKNTNLFPSSRSFSTWKYYSLDVILFSVLLLISILFSLLLLVKNALKWRSGKESVSTPKGGNISIRNSLALKIKKFD